jgi:hypothetical protein
MTHDDELRSRLGRLAESRGTADLRFDDVKERRERRGRQQRVLAVAALFTLVLGTVGVIRLLNDDGSSEVEIASEPKSDETAEDDADEDTPRSTTTTTVPAGEGSDIAAATAFDGGGYGPDWIVPWGDGFLSLGQVFEPSDLTMQDLIPDIADRFPPEVIEALNGVTDLNESVEILTEAGLIDQATEIVTGDPELFDAYNQVQSGGTSRFEASVSPDGENWTVLSDFAVPGGSQYFNSVQSDGEHLVVSEQIWDEESGRTREILVSSTTDLVGWTTNSIPIERPDVPDYVTADAHLEGVAIGDGGWYATVQTSMWIDIWSLVSDDLRIELESSGYGWTPRPEGLVIESYEEFEDPPISPADGPSEVGTIPWSELGITYDDYIAYDSGDSYPGNGSAAAWVGTWDGSIAPAGAARSTDCCQVIGTDSGFIAVSWAGDFSRSDPTGPELYFSADGQTWNSITAPPVEGWLGVLAAVDEGVVMTVSTDDGTQHLWRGDASGRDWQPIEIPGLPESSNIWFEERGSRGIATVVDLTVYDYDEQVEFETSMEWDGYEIYTFNHSDGTVDFRITDLASRDVVAENVLDVSRSTLPEFLDYSGTTVDFLDIEGELIVSVPMEEATRVTSEAEEAAREASGWVEPDYDYNPDFWLVASHDGIDWHVEDLADTQEGWYGQAAINGNTVVMRGDAGWVALDIG